MHHFKCHSARTCYTWAAGGPITEDSVSEEWQEKNQETIEEAGRCQKGYKTHATQKTKKMFGKSYRNCVKAEGVEVNEQENLQGSYIGTIDDLSRTLYRISRHSGPVRSSDKPSDRDFDYTNSDGKVEHRIYFFSSQDEALGVLFAGATEISAYIGDVSADDDLDNLYITAFSAESFPKEVEFFEDPELENSSAIYGAFPDGRQWKMKPKTATMVMDLLQDLEDEDDDYYY